MATWMTAGRLARQHGDRSTVSRRLATWQLAAQHALFAIVPVIFTIHMFDYSIGQHAFAIDFHNEFWAASHRVLQGLNPYDQSWMNLFGGVAFPYPAVTALAFVPLALLNHVLADWIFTFVNLGAVLLTLRVLNVRDWRVYGLVLILWPVVLAWQTANLTLVLGLGIACLWRKRDNPAVAGVLVAVMISLKPSIWPLGLWLLATRRYRAVAYGAACGLALNVVSWAVIGFDRIHPYSQVVSAVNHVADRRGYSFTALVQHLGGGHTIAYVIAVAIGAAVAIACVLVGRRGDARSALAFCVALCLLGTPVLHAHYFALLIIPLALFRPRLDLLWLLPLILYACPANGAQPWQIAIAIATSTVVFGSTLRPPRTPAANATQANARARAWTRVLWGPARAITTTGPKQ
jgi:hypothetical protein